MPRWELPRYCSLTPRVAICDPIAGDEERTHTGLDRCCAAGGARCQTTIHFPEVNVLTAQHCINHAHSMVFVPNQCTSRLRPPSPRGMCKRSRRSCIFLQFPLAALAANEYPRSAGGSNRGGGYSGHSITKPRRTDVGRSRPVDAWRSGPICRRSRPGCNTLAASAVERPVLLTQRLSQFP